MTGSEAQVLAATVGAAGAVVAAILNIALAIFEQVVRSQRAKEFEGLLEQSRRYDDRIEQVLSLVERLLEC